MKLVYKARVLLINMGKMLPFILCGIIIISYAETLVSLITQDFVEWNNSIIPNHKVSWFIGNYFEYDFITLLAFVILSIAISTCVYNKLACAYLWFNLLEKSYLDFELEPTTIYIICTINIAISGYLTLKGIKQIKK